MQGHEMLAEPSASQVIEQIVRIAVVLVGSFIAINLIGLDTVYGVCVALSGNHPNRRPAVALNHRGGVGTVGIPQGGEMNPAIVAVLPEDPSVQCRQQGQSRFLQRRMVRLSCNHPLALLRSHLHTRPPSMAFHNRHNHPDIPGRH